MHEAIRRELAVWLTTELPIGPFAELGSYDLNGGVRDFVPGIVGFDAVAGPGVDVVVSTTPPWPAEHGGRYGALIGASSIQFCNEPRGWFELAAFLLMTGGRLWASGCGTSCHTLHSTSPNGLGWRDMWRLDDRYLRMWGEPFFDHMSIVRHVTYGHEDWFLTATKRGTK
mgnify:CR=1 FL=1